MPHRNALPHGYRIIRVTTGGTGRGDELFAWQLQRWTTTTQRTLILRRKHNVTGWHPIETSDPHDHNDDHTVNQLAATARAIYQQEHPEP